MDQISAETPQPQAPPPMTDAMRQEIDRQAQLARLGRIARSGISNFYWIAALSVINSLVDIFGGGIHFVAGLAATEVVDGFASVFVKDLPDLALFLRVLQFALDIGVIGLFVLFGYLGLKNQRWAIYVGMVLYALDAVLMLVFQDYIAFLFHLYFLWGLWNGLQALNRLLALLAAQPQSLYSIPPTTR